ncbi:TssN family type VI secretion system protein [Spirosoma taeanense]|uniref:TssN family type VI secretion system protein n=1 Tax=Spirosoma taeanense TaxID=2735870 RepID=A0A6M5YCC4_9BACT|nr:TssN family type VI secretion system protein [Spirosoma taeanense]QJW91639.1 TssN family type VI secretion system protein [Spirosoma taeanense]
MLPITSFLVSYLLLLLLTVGMLIATVWLNQKHTLMSTKRLLLIVLIGALILTVPGGFGLIGLQFIPIYYIIVQIISLLLGVVFLNRILTDMGPSFKIKPWFVLFLTGSVLGFGVLLFTPLFNYLSNIQYGSTQYDLWASTSLLPVCLPILFAYTFNAMTEVPNEIYKLWYYPRHSGATVMEDADYYRLMLLEVQVHKHPSQKEPPIKVKARTTGDLPFGLWFQKFIDDYNYKFPNDPIQIFDDTAHEYGWLFYSIKPSLFRLRSYIDFEQTIAQNKLQENSLIVAKRVEEIS